MHVGIDGACWNNRRSYGRFLRELLYAVARLGGNERYTVFLDALSYADFPLGEPFCPLLVETSRPTAEAAEPRGRRSLGDLLRMARAAARQKLDVFFFPSVDSYFPLLRRIPAVLGVHDMIADPRWRVRLALKQADAILTASEYSKRCLESRFRLAPARIRVLYEAASPQFRKVECEEDPDRYILYVGGIGPHKNLGTLIRAFSRLRARESGLRLILVGDYKSDGFKECYTALAALVRSLELEAQVVFAGYVPDRELCILYSRASLFAMPSIDEGFGLPALEAMACGLPVVVGSGNALEEVVGEAGMVVDAHDVTAFAAAMDLILEDADLRTRLAARALERAAQFSWDNAARDLVAILHETARLRG